MATEMDVRATWATEWQFEVDDDTGHHITLDVDQQEGGHNEGFRPMGMLLVALAGCMGMSVLPILPKVFTEIRIEHVVSGHNVQPEAMRRSIELAETKYCGVSAMLGKTARITNTFRLLQAE